MLKKPVLIFSFLVTGLAAGLAIGQNESLVPSGYLAECASWDKCELVFTDNTSHNDVKYKIILMDSKDIDLSDVSEIVLETYNLDYPRIAGIVAQHVDVDDAVNDVAVGNTYTSYTNPEISEYLKANERWFSGVITEAVISEDPGGEKKPPPTCPPDCNNRFVFIPPREFLPNYGGPFESIMEMPILVPVFVPDN